MSLTLTMFDVFTYRIELREEIVIDRIGRKLVIYALLAACVGVPTIATAQSDESASAGAIGSSLATKAVLGARTQAGAARGGSGVLIQPDWGSSGQNNHNTRSAAAEHTINAGNVGNLKTAWISTTAGDVSATATVVNGVAYFPDWGGKLWAIDTKTGKAIWSHDVSDYTGTVGSASRTSPAYWNGELVIGTGNLMTPGLSPAFEIGINARSGELLWRTEADENQAAIVTGSATIDSGIVYTGVSSKTEHTTITPTFRGSVEALDARTGKILWKTYMVPAGFNGAAVWSSQPVVDHRTGMLYVTTGNSYSVPKGYCVNPGQTNCKRLPPDAYIDSIVALRLTTGKIVWAHHTLTADTWTMADPNASPDFDFGADPNLYTTTIEGKRTDVLGAGQKSGMYWALDANTGATVWTQQVGPGGHLGGIHWGTATDGVRIYVEDNIEGTTPFTLGGKGPMAGMPAVTGTWSALDVNTGEILWQVPDPAALGGTVSGASTR